MRGVVAFDVEGRIGFGIAEPLRVAQAFVEGEPILLHAREDVIAGAVEDAVDARERVAVKPFAQRLHDRDAAGDRSLEIERHAMAFGERGELVAVAGKQRLVGGDHRLAGGKRRLHRPFGRIAGAADHLDQNIDRGVARQRDRIRDPAKFSQIDIALLAARTRAHGDDLDRPAATGCELVVPSFQEMDDGRADGS